MTRRVIFPDPTIWTRTDHNTMADKPAPINRRLDDDERNLLLQLTIWAIAEQFQVSADDAQKALDKFNRESGLYMSGDAVDVYVKTTENDHVLVHCTREWLAFHAHSGEQLTSEQLRKDLTYRPNREQGGTE